MGRYYNGDIDGKFWFALQDSSAADRFGSTGEPTHLSYYFDDSHTELIESELSEIQSKIDIAKIDGFFKKNNGYNDDMLKEAGILKEDLKEYADYKLGIQIRDFVRESGECSFDAEL
jgi:hypothetical protein